MTLKSSAPTWERDGPAVEKLREALMALYATIGAKALYLLFVWLASAAGAAWMAERKGYGERLGLTFGLILTAVGLLIVLLLPARPGSAWKVEGPVPRRRASRRAAAAAAAAAAPAVAAAPPDRDAAPGSGTTPEA
jgi:hypothetical protein